MTPHVHTVSNALEMVFLGLQAFNVAFLLLHDWIPLGHLNNLTAIRSQDKLARSVFVTVLPAVPAAICLFFSARYFGRSFPDWLEMWLWITYGIFLVGMLRAWWIPYLVAPDPQRAERYQTIFAGTHAFLPRRNGIVPDTLHVVFHAAVVATLLVLFVR
jgi:hypothetical protein